MCLPSRTLIHSHNPDICCLQDRNIYKTRLVAWIKRQDRPRMKYWSGSVARLCTLEPYPSTQRISIRTIPVLSVNRRDCRLIIFSGVAPSVERDSDLGPLPLKQMGYQTNGKVVRKEMDFLLDLFSKVKGT